jgi:outer membrane protein assembly factor BamA
MKNVSTAYAVVVACLLICATAQAQTPSAPSAADPSASAIEAGQVIDQPSTKPPLTEKVRRYVEQNPMLQKFEGDGFYPRIGGLSPGSGFAGGAGYRRHVGWMYLDGSALVSTKAYRGIDAEARWLDTRGVRVSTNVTFRNDTQDDFYGLGGDTTGAMRTNFGIRWTDVAARASARLLPWLRVGGDVGYYMPDVRHGRDDSLASIEQTFTDATAPGLARQPDFVHEGVYAEVDSRDVPGFPTRGGLYHAAYSLWNDRTFNEFDFQRFDVEGAHFVGLTAKDVVAARLELQYTNNAPGERVPFYALPYIGGGDTVRTFREFRFRDENAGLFNLELRHKVHSMVHVAGFLDFGKVAHDWQDINPTPGNMKRAYGIGVRGGTAARTFARLDVAWGDGGRRIFLKFAPSF